MKRRTHRLAFAVAATASAVVMLAGQATAAPTDDYVKYYWDANVCLFLTRSPCRTPNGSQC